MSEEEQGVRIEISVPEEDGSASPHEERPPLPPRPSELAPLSSRTPATQGTHAKTRGALLSRATTAVSMTDVNTYTGGVYNDLEAPKQAMLERMPRVLEALSQMRRCQKTWPAC